MLMDCVTCLKHLTPLHCELEPVFFHFKQVYIFLGFFFLLRFGFNFFFSHRLIPFLCDLRGKPGDLKYGFCSKNGKFWMLKFFKEDSIDDVEEEKKEILKSCTDFDGKTNTASDDEEFYSDDDDEKDCSEEDGVDDVATLRELLGIERQRVNAACAELAKERAASATAAEEAMGMILRLQNEKSLIEMELSQFRRLAEEKQIHDQEVIRSLQGLVWQHQSDRTSQLNLCTDNMEKDGYEEECEVSCFNGEILDAFENVLYSSRDAHNLSPEMCC